METIKTNTHGAKYKLAIRYYAFAKNDSNMLVAAGEYLEKNRYSTNPGVSDYGYDTKEEIIEAIDKTNDDLFIVERLERIYL